jgi:drug/metabolite transporter (DMT)-like permease
VEDTRRTAPFGGPPPRDPWIRVATREPDDHSRTSPRMRFDLLQLGAWAGGVFVIVCGLVGLARAGFEELDLFAPVVEVAGLPSSPLLALLLVLLGIALLAAATGQVDERSLRIGGAMLGIVGAVWLVEPSAFTPYLGVERANGTAALLLGAVLVVTSFVPPLSIRRPGVGSRR